MSSTFGLYSRYYDLLYRDKDYGAEVDYIRSLMQRFQQSTRDILELGCGTGKHATLLAKAGFTITGVEQSDEMIQAAKDLPDQVKILQGDARSVRLNRKFDTVLSIFHVVSYQESNADVADMFETSALHLRDGGCFIFDVWHGPAVLAQLPEPRGKQMEDDQTTVVRNANPVIDIDRNLVDVNYDITITDKRTGKSEQLQECHRMRYFFSPEIDLFAQSAGLKLVHSEQWLSGAEPSTETWGVTYVLKKAS